MSSDDDIALENLVIRHKNQRKRLGNAKKHKYRRYFKGNGFLSKTLVVESSREDYDKMVMKNEKEERTDDISRGVIYSQGKKKRWLLRDALVKEGAPEPQEHVTSVSVVLLDRQRADQFHSKWLYEGTNRSDFRDPLHKSKIRSISVKTKDGQTMKKGNFQNHLPFVPTNSERENRLHLEYQVLDFRDSYKIHDSYGLRPYHSDWNLSPSPVVEGCILSRDIVRDSDGSWITGYRERPAGVYTDRAYSIDVLSDEKEEIKASHRKDLTLGDFMPHFPPLPKKGRPRALSIGWDWVVS